MDRWNADKAQTPEQAQREERDEANENAATTKIPQMSEANVMHTAQAPERVQRDQMQRCNNKKLTNGLPSGNKTTTVKQTTVQRNQPGARPEEATRSELDGDTRLKFGARSELDGVEHERQVW